MPLFFIVTKSRSVGALRDRSARASRVSERGFNLIELMITLAVAVILVMVAVPSFRSLMLSNKLTTTANDMVDAIHTARIEAVKRNTTVQLCSDSAGANTSDALGSACGTLAGAVVVSGNATPVRAGIVGIATPIQLSGSITPLRFNGQGIGSAIGSSAPYTGPVMDICTSALSTGNHRVVTMTAGSGLVTTTTTSTSCP